jgi:mRNA-degrading endonuclease RelE of RelBE toxin-antitoxin system
MFTIAYARSVSDDLAGLRATDRNRILDRIHTQLKFEPTTATRNRKILPGLVPPWEHKVPTWELRVGAYRVFYDVDEEAKVVTVQAIRHKPPHKTLEQIL